MPNYATPFSDPGGNGQVAYPSEAGQLISNRYTFQLGRNGIPNTLLANDIVDIGILPANCTIEDILIDTDDLDTNATPLISVDVGIMSGTPGDVVSARSLVAGQEAFLADTTARTGGIARTTRQQILRVAPVGFDRSIGVRIVAVAATWAAAGTAFNVQVAIRG
jgi:hypothetical protein